MLEEGALNISLRGPRNDLLGKKCGGAIGRRRLSGTKGFRTGLQDDEQDQEGTHKELFLREVYTVSPEKIVGTLVSALTPLKITSQNFIGLIFSAAGRTHKHGDDANGIKLRRFMKRFLKSHRGLSLSLDRLQSLAAHARKRSVDLGLESRMHKSNRRMTPCGGGGLHGSAANAPLPDKIEYLRDMSQLSLLAFSSVERMMTLIRIHLDLILDLSDVEKGLTQVLFDLTRFKAELATLANCMAGVRCAVVKYDAHHARNISNPMILATLAHKAINIFAETLSLLNCECDKSFRSCPEDIEKAIQMAVCASAKMIKRLKPVVRCLESADARVKISSAAGSLLLDSAEVFAIDIIRVVYTVSPAIIPCAHCSEVPRALSRLRQIAALMHRLVSEYKLNPQTTK